MAYSLDEVAKMTGLCKMTVIREIKEGKLLSSRIGKRHLITEEEIHRWLDAAKGKRLEPTK